jgi:hypothetical protein
MLTPRNFIGLTIAIAVFSILSLCWSMLQTPDGGGLRADSFGTRGIGHRAIFESLEELGVPVHRELGPPKPNELNDSLLVLWAPRIRLIEADPKWLRDVESWLQQGGHAVVAFDGERQETVLTIMQRQNAARRNKDNDDGDNGDDSASSGRPELTVFELLGLGKLDITNVADPDSVDDLSDSEPRSNGRKRNQLPSDVELKETIREVLTASLRLEKPQRHTTKATGVFAETIFDGATIELPAGLLYEINLGERDIHDTISVVDESGIEHCVAAQFPVGKGHVNVVSIRRLISNANIGSADNIVVAAALLIDGGRSVVFDEFYHGATIRGNPMWLISTVRYGSVVVALLLFLTFSVWRAAIFLGPPVAETPTQRRSIREYLDAMSRFLRESKEHGKWSLEQVRDGVLWRLRREFGLPPESHDQSRLTVAIARKDPHRADRLIDVLNEVEAVLNMPRPARARCIAELVQRMTECLSKTATTRSAPRSPK